MAEYFTIAPQTVAANESVVFSNSRFPRGNGMRHENGSALVYLNGNTTGCVNVARYKLTFDANIALPTGGTVGPISVALALNGEALGNATAIVTPAAVGDLWAVSRAVNVAVPKGGCLTATVKNTSGQPLTVQNANIIVDRIG